MASYDNNPASANPFFSNPPVVMVVRHVRITGSGEIVKEDPNALTRYLMRASKMRTLPQMPMPNNSPRNFPNIGNKKESF